jgi:hypothetical protein
MAQNKTNVTAAHNSTFLPPRPQSSRRKHNLFLQSPRSWRSLRLNVRPVGKSSRRNPVVRSFWTAPTWWLDGRNRALMSVFRALYRLLLRDSCRGSVRRQKRRPDYGLPGRRTLLCSNKRGPSPADPRPRLAGVNSCLRRQAAGIIRVSRYSPGQRPRHRR